MDLSHGGLSVWEDRTGEASLPDALAAFEAGAFRSLPGSLALGFKSGAAWLHAVLEVRPGAGGERWLELHPAYVDRFDLYLRGPDGLWQHRAGGDLLPQSVKAIPYRGHIFPVSLAPGRYDLFLRLASESDLAAAPVLWKPEAFQAFGVGLYWADGVLLGVAAAIAFLNAFIFLRRRTLLEGVFAVTVIISTLQWSAPSGLLAEWLFPETPRWGSRAGGVLVCLYSASMWGFFMALFEARRYHRVFYRIGQLALALGMAGTVLTVLGFYRYTGPVIHGLSIVAFLLAPVVMVRLWRQGDVASRAIVAAIGVYALTTLMIVLRNLGVLWLTGTEILARLAPLMVFLVAFQAALVVRSSSLRIALAKAQVEQEALKEEGRQAAQAREDRESSGPGGTGRGVLRSGLADGGPRKLRGGALHRLPLALSSPAGTGVSSRGGVVKVGHALLRRLLGCFALFLCVDAFSADHHFPPPSLSGDGPLVLSDGHLAFWLDRSGEASLAKALDARARGAFESLPGPLGLGYVEGVAWLHF